MNKLFALLFVVIVLTNCESENVRLTECGVPATVRDFTGLDGCGYVFELSDGKILEPLRVFFCGTPPLPKEQTEDPLHNFQFEDGKKVLISYEPVKGASICMAGQLVKINCISESIKVSE